MLSMEKLNLPQKSCPTMAFVLKSNFRSIKFQHLTYTYIRTHAKTQKFKEQF